MSVINPPPPATREYMENSQWLLGHATELMREYPNQWVAIHGGKVVAAGPALGAVIAKAARLAPTSDTVVHFVDDGMMIFSI